MTSRCEIRSVEELHVFARALAAKLRGGEFIGLSGPLGAGKTEFVRGLAAALSALGEVSSPSFVLEAIYALPQERTLHHWDFYRLSGNFPIEELSEGALDAGRITVIEWPERVPEILPYLNARIYFAFGDLPNSRDLDLEGDVFG
jgi:tRNA threonylcarbamoyladenosine biosynthesis protein TsaE